MKYNWLDKISPIPKHCGSRHFQRGIINPWRVIYDFELFIVSEGDAEFIVEKTKIHYDCPYYIIMCPGKKHISRCLSRSARISWVHFDWIHTERKLERHVDYNLSEIDDAEIDYPDFIPKKLFHGALGNNRPLDLHYRMSEMFNLGNSRLKKISRALLLQELLELLESRKTITPSESHEETIASNLLNFLTELAHRPVNQVNSVKDEIRKLGKSYFHQERIFKKLYGVTPYQYVNNIRIERIKNQLVETDASVSEIAYNMGYEDLAYFSRFFSLKTGTSPRAFRHESPPRVFKR